MVESEKKMTTQTSIEVLGKVEDKTQLRLS